MQSSRTTNAPKSWMQHLSQRMGNREPDQEGDVDFQLQLLNILRSMFPQAVHAASYDYLKEVNCSTASFLICNATLRKTGRSWETCRGEVNRRGVEIHKSPPLAAVDVVRLSRLVKNAMMNSTAAGHCKNLQIPIVESPEVIKAANSMPLRCDNLDGLFKAETDRWFARSGAQPPRSRSKPFCHVATDLLEPEHWRTIRSLLPGC